MAWTPPTDPARDAAATSALQALAEQIRRANGADVPLSIRGGATKDCLLEPALGETLNMAAYCGVIAYEPAELVIELRAGTLLAEVETLLAAHDQQLACEPPRYGTASTIGGVVSAGFSGPARPWAGALRDHILGVGLLSPAGELLRFGGRVMKNVAGYDVSRLAVGAWGTLGPVATLALRVAPRPERSVALAWPMSAQDAATRMQTMARTSWPLAGAAHDGTQLRLRLAGTAAAVDEAVAALNPPTVEADLGWWEALRDLRLPALRAGAALWRVSVPPAAVIEAPGAELLDWGGAQRWWTVEDTDAADIHARVRQALGSQGYAMPMFAAPVSAQAPVAPVQRALQTRIAEAFDPKRIFNRGCSRLAV